MQKEYKKGFNKSLFLFLLGTLCLFLYIYLSVTQTGYMVELASIIGTFAIWESLSFFLIERRDVKENYVHAINMLSSEIRFVDEKKGE